MDILIKKFNGHNTSQLIDALKKRLKENLKIQYKLGYESDEINNTKLKDLWKMKFTHELTENQY